MFLTWLCLVSKVLFSALNISSVVLLAASFFTKVQPKTHVSSPNRQEV